MIVDCFVVMVFGFVFEGVELEYVVSGVVWLEGLVWMLVLGLLCWSDIFGDCIFEVDLEFG